MIKKHFHYYVNVFLYILHNFDMDHNQDNLEEIDAVFLFKKKYYLPEDGIKLFGV